MISDADSMVESRTTLMDNFDFPGITSAVSVTDSVECLSLQRDEQRHQVSFSGMSTAICAPEKAQMPSPSRDYQLMKEQKPLSELSSLRHESLFQTTHYSLETTTFQEDNPLEQPCVQSKLLQNIDAVIRRELCDPATPVPVQTICDAPESKAIIITDTQKELTRSSVDENTQHILSETRVKSQKRLHSSIDDAVTGLLMLSDSPGIQRRSHSSAGNGQTPTPKKTRSQSSTTPLSRPGIVSTSAMMPVMIARNNVQPLSSRSLSRRVPERTDQWIIRTPMEKRPFKCAFSGCGKMANTLSDLRKHFFVHTGISKHKCPYKEKCGDKYFRDATDLKRHIFMSHTKKKALRADASTQSGKR